MEMKSLKILILEDDLGTVEIITKILREIENEENVQIGVTVIPDYIQTEEFINKNPQVKFDILLLDRDCFLGGSFHTVNLENFDKDKVVSISSIPEWNRQAQERGIKRVVLKDFLNLDFFSQNLKKELKTLL